MATETGAIGTTTTTAAGDRSLFVRKATGLVRGWSMLDGSIYAFYACNIVFGLWVLSFAPFIPHGSLFWAVVLCSAFVFFEILTYAALVSVMPRAGGDYVWQSRILSGGTAFVLAATGWWFILWHWVPLYANATVISVFQPLLKIVGADGVSNWFTSKNGIFVSSVIVVLVTSAYISLGMRGYARFQRISFIAGAIGFAIFVIVMLVNSKTGFIHAFNREAHDLYGTNGDAYNATIKKSGYGAAGPLHFDVGATFSLVGFMAFFLLWPNWGATLAGEVRGANDLKKNVKAMSVGLLLSAGAALIFIGLFAKTFGWDFYTAANNGYGSGNGVLGAYPYPVMLGSWLVDSPLFQFILIALFSLWIFGWYGTVFLSSTRVIFATAFDRILPERAAYISPNRRVPVTALLLMAIPSIIVSALYAYWGSFARYSLDATLVIVITYIGSSFAAMIMPWRVKRLYRNSLLARWKLFGIPAITVVGFVSFGFLSYILAIYLADSVYGVNNRDSLIYMAILYAIALVIYAVAKVVRRRQGTPLENVMREIPAE